MKFPSISSLVLLIVIGSCANCLAITGKWRGYLSIGTTKLPLVLNLTKTGNGDLMATLDSPQQNATNIPLEVLLCSEDSISVECRMLGASYKGKFMNGNIDGVFEQRGYTFPLLMSPEEDLYTRRPQTPRPPFPYVERDTFFLSSDGTRLAATLTLPDKKPGVKFPTVVMVTGSGPQNRDEEIFEHRPFAVIADYLARNGIASFRYDDRGTASSEGNYPASTIDTFKEDLQSAFKFVRDLPETGKSGILGHSEGGTLAVLAAHDTAPDFIISLAGMVIPAKETLLDQNIHTLDQLGITGKDKDSSVKLVQLLFDEIAMQTGTGNVSPINIDQICQKNSLDVPPIVLESIRRNNLSRNGYFDSLVCLDPTDALHEIKCPVLAVNGTKDIQVDADKNLDIFSRSVKNIEIRKMEGLNHLMQPAVTGEVSEYAETKETISTDVLNLIVDFIKKYE